MKIRHCPHCAQLVHFTPQTAYQSCWHCGLATNFSRIKTADERLLIWLGARLQNVSRISILPNTRRSAGLSRFMLLAALPPAATMLLLCNSFDLRHVGDLRASFATPPRLPLSASTPPYSSFPSLDP